MDQQINTQRLLVLRKLTRAIGDLLRTQLKDYLSTLTPLLRPTHVLGEYIQGSSKVTVKGADRAFKELQGLYDAIAARKPFEIHGGLQAPIEVLSSTPEIMPVEYPHLARSADETKTVTVTSPFKWMLTYAGFGVPKLKELVDNRRAASRELSELLMHFLVLKTVVSHQTGLMNILSDLHFPVSWEKVGGFGELPLTCISCSIGSFLPPDPVIIESTEISGVAVFEEVVELADIARTEEPFKRRLVELMQSYGEALPQE
jgi:hypothetical protein